jgi:hypothetical protein
MLILLQDAQRVPNVFDPFGAIPTAELGEWLRQNGLVLPSDLIELWELTGGGDIFESETVFRPIASLIPNSSFVEDDIESRNAAHSAKVTLTNDYVPQNSFGSLDDWYIHTLRAEFGERYGLSAL